MKVLRDREIATPRAAGPIAAVWGLALLTACPSGSTTPPASPEPAPAPPEASVSDSPETAPPTPEPLVELPPPPRVDLAGVRFAPLQIREARDDGAPTVLVSWGVVSAPTDEDDAWSIGDGIGGTLEHTAIDVPTRDLAKVKELAPVPLEVMLIGPETSCVAKIGKRARIDYDEDGFEVAEVYLRANGCKGVDRDHWAPVAIVAEAWPEPLTYVPAIRKLYVSEGKIEKGEHPLSSRILDVPRHPPEEADQYGEGRAEGWLDVVEGVSPPVATLLEGVTFPHRPPPPAEPEPCMGWTEWGISVGQVGAKADTWIDYPASPDDQGDFDLQGALVHQGHVQAVIGAIALDLAILVPELEPKSTDATEGFAQGTWVTLVTGEHHDEDVAYARSRVGETCEP